MPTGDRLEAISRAAAGHGGLRLLVLHGSRGRDEAHGRSDWDLGYVGDATLDPAALLATLTEQLGTDTVDLVDLERASALLRFQAAGHGRCLYERTPGSFETFVLDATLFWCDAEPVIRRAHAAVLDGLSA